MCVLCGQPLPATPKPALGYGDKRVNAGGLAVTVLLHLLLLLVFLLRPHAKKPPPLLPDGSITYIAPVAAKPRSAPSKPSPAKPKKRALERIEMVRLPNTITLPREKPVVAPPPVEPEPPKMAKADPAEDMASMIEARRRARGQSEQPAEESEAERGNRIARANIAGANGPRPGQGASNGAFSVTEVTFHSAQVKLDTKFLGSTRPSLKLETVELGSEPDVETAAVRKLIDMLRREKFIDFTFTSQRTPGRSMELSTRPEYRAELEAVLMKEIFPNYRPPRR